MHIEFYKYQGTGNDFVVVDNRALSFKPTNEQVNLLCDRRFGIGADGLILLEPSNRADFHMAYYNADGKESTMCGNGGRCITAFAHFLKIIEEDCLFTAVDGEHRARYKNGYVDLKMIDVSAVKTLDADYVLNTGSPHYVSWTDNLQDLPLNELSRQIRFSEAFKSEGINVNFVESVSDSQLAIRTYERGVEDETLSCGTGSVAAALAFATQNSFDEGHHEIGIKTMGGDLKIRFLASSGKYSDVYLCGPAKQVFRGIIEV